MRERGCRDVAIRTLLFIEERCRERDRSVDFFFVA